MTSRRSRERKNGSDQTVEYGFLPPSETSAQWIPHGLGMPTGHHGAGRRGGGFRKPCGGRRAWPGPAAWSASVRLLGRGGAPAGARLAAVARFGLLAPGCAAAAMLALSASIRSTTLAAGSGPAWTTISWPLRFSSMRASTFSRCVSW